MKRTAKWLLGIVVFLLTAFLALDYEFDVIPKREAKSFIDEFHRQLMQQILTKSAALRDTEHLPKTSRVG